jgi:polysaccharide pyruvyl transferase WcaK-like protein
VRVTRVVIAACEPDDNRGTAALKDASCAILARAFPRADIALISVRGLAHTAAAYRHSMKAHPNVKILPPLLAQGRPDLIAAAARALVEMFWYAAPWALPTTDTGKTLRTADVVIALGGYMLRDQDDVHSWLVHSQSFLPVFIGRRLARPTFILPTSVVEPRTRIGRWALGRLARAFDGLAARDPRSLQTARMLGAHRVALYPDVAFALTPPSLEDARDTQHRFGLSEGRYALFTTRNLHDVDDTRKVAIQAAVARRLLADRAIDCAFVYAQTVGPDLDETSSARRLVEAIGPGARLLDGDFSHRDLMSLCAGADLVFSQHLHSFIFSTLVGTPALAFSTDGHKIEGVVEGLGLPDWLVLDVRSSARPPLTETDAGARVARLRSARGEISARMADGVKAAREGIDRLVTDLAAASRP